MRLDTDFERVWQRILEVARMKKEIKTLVHKVPNQIVSAREDAIVVSSKRTGYQKERELRKENFQNLWHTLTQRGQLNVDDIQKYYYKQYWQKQGCIMMAFLAHLGNVKFSIRPLTLYLMPTRKP